MKLTKIVLATALGAASLSANAYISSWDWETSTGFMNLGTAQTINALVDPDPFPVTPYTGTDALLANANQPYYPYAPEGQARAPGYAQLTSAIENTIIGVDVYQAMAWGIPSSSNQSNIIINNKDSDDEGIDALVTDGDWVRINDFTHNNYVLQGGSSNSTLAPWSALLFGGFEFTNTADYLVQEAGSPNAVTLDETRNAISVDRCVDPTPNNTACDDIFSSQGLSGTFLFYQDLTTEGFVRNYFVEFAFDPGTNPDDIIIGPDEDGYYQIYTGEEGATTVHTMARVFTRIPEPSVLALFGIGLLGMGFLGRRRNKA
ncbi:MAG: THxN family PEP-CTERM protein [Sedimenticola sp.]